ncbi:MAG: sigma-70 family RNA polymerase sigma factor [Candidatus Paceibacterota bacterium]|jgi:RNA polymerase sigma-70 factor (ECF subfamily)
MKEEELLIQKAKQGDDISFGKLYDTYLPSIYRFVFLKIGRKEDAEDITQKVFVSAWQSLKGFEFKGFPFSSWLYRIASNAVIDYYRTWKGNISIDLVPEEYFSESMNEEGRIDDNFDIARVRTAIAKLEPDQQNVVIMKFVSDLSNKEIAESLGKTEGAIRVIQHRALKQLKTLIDTNEERHNRTTKEA